MARVLIFQWGEISINTYYLAQELQRKKVDVELFLYTPPNTYKAKHLEKLLATTKEHVNTTEIKPSLFEVCLTRINHLTALFGKTIPALFSNPLLPYRTKRRVYKKPFDVSITVGQTSLYWLYRTSEKFLHSNIHYSLEVQKISDPYFITRDFMEIIKIESRLINNVKGLIIQDYFRAEALLNLKVEQIPIKLFFVPISVPGKIHEQRLNYLHDNLNLDQNKKIILYFGALYEERYIKTIATTFSENFDENSVLVLHGPDDFSSFTIGNPNIKTSNKLLEYNELYKIISSASIGLAFYDNGWPNTRFTAFSSEKIARYLQCGVPFIAFKNESYEVLKKNFDCCELISEIEQLPSAIKKINSNYDYYRTNSFKAFEKYFSIESSYCELISYINTNAAIDG